MVVERAKIDECTMVSTMRIPQYNFSLHLQFRYHRRRRCDACDLDAATTIITNDVMWYRLVSPYVIPSHSNIDTSYIGLPMVIATIILP